ncbi:MAG TPA: transaldolase family protein [Terriglobales bacterium]|nr:transaldolase family protein [Terriglobales bacterium]
MSNVEQNKVTETISGRTLKARLKTKILVDGGDADETRHVKDVLGFVDGQTTNPSLIAKNPEIRQLIASGHRLSEEEENQEYKKIVQQISPLVGDAGVSIEVFSDLTTTAEQMVRQGKDMFTWIPNAYIKYPCTKEGLRAAEISVAEGIRVNMTLCFSQAQAAAVYAATRGSKEPVYVSPFIGRLDDRGENGVDLISNIKRMYAQGDGHVLLLAASIRNLQHLIYAFWAQAELTTVPAHVLEQWAGDAFPLPDPGFRYEPVGTPIQYQEIDLNQPWRSFNIEHELTRKGIEKFVADYRATLYQTVA